MVGQVTPCRINSHLAYCCKHSFWLLASLAGTFGNRSFGGNLTAMLSLKPDEICVMTMASKPEITATTFDANIVAQTHKVDSTTSDVDVTTHSAEGDLEILEQTEIYSAHFRTSSYSTFAEKMSKMTVGDIVPWQEYPFVYNLKANIVDQSATIENIDFTEYDNNSDVGNIKIRPVYSKTLWYVDYVKPLMYGNADLRKVLGNIEPPTNREIIYWYNSYDFTKLSDNAIETGARITVGGWNNINNHMQQYIDDDLFNYRTIVSSKLADGTPNTAGIQQFMNANNIPATTKGAYPIEFEYTLPGKNKTTSKYQISLNL